MANKKYPETTHEQLLEDALNLLHDVQIRLGMFEKQDYWKIKLKAEGLKQRQPDDPESLDRLNLTVSK